MRLPEREPIVEKVHARFGVDHSTVRAVRKPNANSPRFGLNLNLTLDRIPSEGSMGVEPLNTWRSAFLTSLPPVRVSSGRYVLTHSETYAIDLYVGCVGIEEGGRTVSGTMCQCRAP